MDPSLQRRLDAMRSLPNTSTANIMEKFRHGDDAWTRAVAGTTDIPSIKRIVNHGGAIDFVLQNLQHAQTQTWDDILATMGTPGDLSSPTIWINFLENVIGEEKTTMMLMQPKAADKLRMKIAKKLGPLTSVMLDMENTNNRKLFGQQDYWYQSVVHYVGLVRNLLLSSCTIPIMIGYENGEIRNFLVRMLFLEGHGGELRDTLQNNPLIRNPTKNIGVIQALAAGAIHELVNVPADYGIFSPQSKESLAEMASILVSPGSDITLSTGILEIAWNPSEPMLNDNISYRYLMYVIRMFLMGLGEEWQNIIRWFRSRALSWLLP